MASNDKPQSGAARLTVTVAIHAVLASRRWMEISLVEQLANIGSEVGRATRAKASGRDERLVAAVGRALELFDLTLADPRWRGRRREIARSREIVCDFLVGDNTYRTTAESLEAYFLPFAVAARRRREAGPPNPSSGSSTRTRTAFRCPLVILAV